MEEFVLLLKTFADNFYEAIIISLLIIIFYLLQINYQKKKFKELEDNHFHEILETLKKIENKIDLITRQLVAIKVRLKINDVE